VANSKQGGGNAQRFKDAIKFAKNPIPSNLLDSYLGNYISPERSFTIERVGNRLIAIVKDSGEYAIYPRNSDLFYIPFSPVTLKFNKDSNGVIDKIIMHRGEKQIDIKKVK
jgi:hypothetical protein